MNQSEISMLAETHRGTVAPWQCDSNGHWNARFYCMHFDLAARFAAVQGGVEMSSPAPRTRHLRFHAELVGGDIFRIATGRIADGERAGSLVHYMTHAGTGKLVATALDARTDAAQRAPVPAIPGELLSAALPRSVADLEGGPVPHQQMLDSGAFVAARNWVQMEHCTVSGELCERDLAGMIADSAGHVWEHAGAGVVWLRENGMGRAAVEFRIEHHEPARAGDPIELLSRVGPVQGKAIRLQHQLYRMTDRKPIAGAEVVAVLIDMATRRSVPMPEFLARP